MDNWVNETDLGDPRSVFAAVPVVHGVESHLLICSSIRIGVPSYKEDLPFSSGVKVPRSSKMT